MCGVVLRYNEMRKQLGRLRGHAATPRIFMGRLIDGILDLAMYGVAGYVFFKWLLN